MNHFPKFEPNIPSSVQLTSVRLNAVSLGQKSNQIQPGVGYRVTQTPGGTTVSPIKRRSSGGTTTLNPWQPVFFQTGTGPATVYKCRFNLGTVNQVVAGNWNDAFTLPSDDTIKFIVLTITTASGDVTGVSISVDTAPPTSDVIAKDTPPVSFKIVLGAIGKTTAKMIVTTNIQVLASEVFRESVAAPATGAEPFSRWWRWEVQ